MKLEEAKQAVQDALRKFEEAHAKWMDTSKFSADADAITRAKNEAARGYSFACRVFDEEMLKHEKKMKDVECGVSHGTLSAHWAKTPNGDVVHIFSGYKPGQSGILIAEIPGSPLAMREAERIIACLNAMVGIETSVVTLYGVGGVKNQLKKLTEQRNELAEVAQAVKDWGNMIDPHIRKMAKDALAKLDEFIPVPVVWKLEKLVDA